MLSFEHAAVAFIAVVSSIGALTWLAKTLPAARETDGSSAIFVLILVAIAVVAFSSFIAFIAAETATELRLEKSRRQQVERAIDEKDKDE
ncbi:unnamed protein product [Agarophyton chilense]